MANLGKYDPNADYGGYDALPAGWYKVAVVESESKPTSTGDGEYLKLVFEVLEGKYAGRKIFQNLCTTHSNPITVRIAMANLKKLDQACGTHAQDSTEFHNIPVMVRLAVSIRSDTGDEQNDVKAYKTVDDFSGGDRDPGGSAGRDQTPPWKRNK